MFQLEQVKALPLVLKVALAASLGLFAFDLLLLLDITISGFSKIDPGIATLTGAIVGLGVIAWQTGKGFDNLIRSQENQARIEREARLHMNELERASEERKTAQARAVLLAALRAEIAHLYGQVVNAQRHINGLMLIARTIRDNAQPPRSKTIVLHSFEAPVFKANIENLGHLGAYLCADIITVLSKANGKEVKFTQDQPFSHDVLITLYEGNLEFLKKWASDLHHVAMRILAQESRAEDPGTLIETQDKRYQKLDDD
jgi:hypothetical protein